MGDVPRKSLVLKLKAWLVCVYSYGLYSQVLGCFPKSPR